jgi:hypothetical protein
VLNLCTPACSASHQRAEKQLGRKVYFINPFVVDAAGGKMKNVAVKEDVVKTGM